MPPQPTGSDDDLIRIRATANGVQWLGPCGRCRRNNTIEIEGNVLQSRIQTGDGFDTIRISGLETDQLQIDSGANGDVLKVDGGTRISYVSGEGSDQLQLTRNYFASLLQADNNDSESNEAAQGRRRDPPKWSNRTSLSRRNWKTQFQDRIFVTP